MKPESLVPRESVRWALIRLGSVTLAIGSLLAAACSTSTSSPMTAGPALAPISSAVAPSPDPRVGLLAGTLMQLPSDTSRRIVQEPAAEASWNLRLLSNTPSTEGFQGVTNSDLGFLGNYVLQGNYNGFQVWDASNPARPTLKKSYLCPASQSDISVYRNLLFVSGESGAGRLDCGTQGVADSVSMERLRGIRIFDITDIANPRYIANVQTCRGSHTHSVVTDPNDNANVYIYVSGSSSVRSPSELPGCSALAPDEDPNSALFRIEVIQVPLAAPQTARIVSSPRVFADLSAAPRRTEPPNPNAGGGGGGGGGRGGGGGGAPAPRTGPNQCHDITTYPAVGLAGGACQGYGILLDISDPEAPKRLFAVADTNFATWHSVTFSNDGTKVLFTDEWGGGSAPRCRATDPLVWGGDAIFRIVNGQLEFQSYYKMSAAQTSQENCVAHNGSLIPVPGRDIKVQGWYQGGISIFDWTDPMNPKEIAFHDRGPLDATRLQMGGSWSSYWYNGYIYSSEIARGLDVFELTPSPFISQNEIDAAKTVRLEYFNAQEQQKFVWPPSFPMARAYLDQLQRSNGLGADRIAAVRAELTRVERLGGQSQRDALTQLATQITADARAAGDQTKVGALAQAVRDLGSAQP